MRLFEAVFDHRKGITGRAPGGCNLYGRATDLASDAIMMHLRFGARGGLAGFPNGHWARLPGAWGGLAEAAKGGG